MNPQLNELVDYIKKARQSGQQDQQTRSILIKNGWSQAETDEAFLSAGAQVAQPQPAQSAQPAQQPAQQKPAQLQPQTQTKPQSQPAQQPAQQFQPQTQKTDFKRKRGNALAIIIATVLILAIAGAMYFVMTQPQIFTKYTQINIQPPQNQSQPAEELVEEPVSLSEELLTKNVAMLSQDYDETKITAVSFSNDGKHAVYCAPLKTGGKKLSCFQDGQKILDNPYAFAPYWAGVSPDGKSTAFLFWDSVKKQSFVLKNGQESARYNGKITYPAFSQNSESFMFVVLAADGGNFVVVNGRSLTPHDKIFTTPALSEDSNYILYGALDEQTILWVADSLE